MRSMFIKSVYFIFLFIVFQQQPSCLINCFEFESNEGLYSIFNSSVNKRFIQEADQLSPKKITNQPNMITDSYGNIQVNPNGPLFIFMCIVYVISTLSAIITNLIVILVYLVGHRAKTDLSIFLINLAIADFLMSTVCMPFSFAQALLQEWPFGDVLCPIVLFKQVLTVSLSIYTMVAIGIDRYYAIKCPLKNRVTHNKARFVMLIVWILSFSLASVQLIIARTTSISITNSTMSEKEYSNYSTHFTVNEDNNLSKGIAEYKEFQSKKFCNENWKTLEQQRYYTLFNLFAVYIIPVFILAYTYACIACIIKQTTHPGNADAYRDMHSTKSKNKVVKMLILLVCVFSLCWLPLHVFTVVKDFTTWLNIPEAIWYFYSAHWLAMANCTINPIIYGYSSKSFRADVYSLIICCKCFTRREWIRQESSKTTSLFKRAPKNGNAGYYNNNLNVGVGINSQKNPLLRAHHISNPVGNQRRFIGKNYR